MVIFHLFFNSRHPNFELALTKASNRASSTISCPEKRLFLIIELFPIIFELGPSELEILSEFCFRDFDDSLDNSPDEIW